MLRGINRQAIFLDEEDHLRFLRDLRAAREAADCRVLAYCLMTNHVHLVLRTGSETVGQVVKRFGVRYAWWYNTKYGRVGHVFQDRFRSRPVEDDGYFVTLLRYVWNNPVKAGMVERPDQYRWSSLSADAPIDQDALLSLIDVATIAQLAATPDPEAIDPDPLPPPRVALTDPAVARILSQFCRQHSVTDIVDLPRSIQQWAIVQSLREGASVRQLARLTSLSRGTVQRLAQLDSTA
ncbi:MAG: transposase [Propionicimonas sp.]|uniref:transposase n=1 Tax=Propionicimonas sp. TaxID=1955623 RepID=UPI002B220F6C|nr:transposase [Propionicimonas sp.]MEA4943373.1 transposase [Propionicimonas sp.]